jgi:hypothetical protein
MNTFRINQSLVLILIVVASFSCYTIGAKLNKGRESLVAVKWRLTEANPLDEATPLKTIVNYNLKKQYSLGYPSSFTISQDTNLYLVDNKSSSIFKVSSDFQRFEQFVKKDVNGLSLQSPFQIKELNNSLYISDNEGLKIFNKNGNLEKTIKPYFGITEFAIENNGQYLVNRSPYEVQDDSPLILKLDSNGKKIDTIGKISSIQYNGIENQVFLETSELFTIVAYKYKPLIEIYDTKTKERLKSFNIKASIFDELVALKQNNEFVNPEPGQYKIPKFIAGSKVFKDKLYLLLHLPYPEIIEFTLNGEEIQRYRSKEVRANDYFGFDIRLINGTTQFVVGAFDLSQKPSILVFEENN